MRRNALVALVSTAMGFAVIEDIDDEAGGQEAPAAFENEPEDIVESTDLSEDHPKDEGL